MKIIDKFWKIVERTFKLIAQRGFKNDCEFEGYMKKMDHISEKLDRFFSRYWIIWTLYFIIPQFITDGIFQKNGYLLSYTGYHWILHIFLLLSGILVSYLYRHPLVKGISIVLFIFEGYMYFRYLLPEISYFNPYIFILNIIAVIPLMFSVLWILVRSGYAIISGINKREGGKSLKRLGNKITEKKPILGIGIIFLVCAILLPISNRGVGNKFIVKDEGNQINRVGFWNYGYREMYPENYTSADAIEELEQLRDMNAFLIIQIHAAYLERQDMNNRYTEMIHIFESYDIEVLFNANPETLVYNETKAEWIPKGDYVTYYHTEYINRTVNLILDWMANETYSNVIGLSLDIEGPIHQNSSHVISRERYEQALNSYSEILNKFKQSYPTMETMQISMSRIMWDTIDSDYDLSIDQLTVDHELDFDKYGYMTYDLTNNPRESSYEYYTSMVQAKKIHGEKFSPWIGWIGKNNSMDNEVFSQSVWDQLKIAKNFAGEEVIIGYFPTFTSDDHETAMRRLQKLEQIMYETYEQTEIKISHREWTETIFPTYWMMNGNILKDILFGDNGENAAFGWWLNLVQTFTLFVGTSLIVKSKKNDKRKIKEKHKKKNK